MLTTPLSTTPLSPSSTATQKKRLGLIGASGRMGQSVLQILSQSPQWLLGSVLQHRRPVVLAKDKASFAHTVVTTQMSVFLEHSDVVLDFSAPADCHLFLQQAKNKKRPYVLCATGLSQKQQAELQEAASWLPLLVAGNTSLGIQAVCYLIEKAQRLLEGFDVEIFELHHQHKKDAPSGTAWMLAQSLRQADPQLAVSTRKDSAVRESKQIGIASLRGGDVVGEHTVYFLGDGERLEIKHTAVDRKIFAQGALTAAAWLLDKAVGFYGMPDVLESRLGV